MAAANVGNSNPISKPIIEITTNSSISVKPFRRRLGFDFSKTEILSKR